MNETVIALGLGNILCGDDGFGVRVVQSLQNKYDFPERCRIIDGGTQGQILYGILEDADRLLVIDAIDFALGPGNLALLAREEIPVWLGARKLSAHQNSFAEVLALGSIKEILPKEICLLGFQGERFEFGSPLSELAQIALPRAESMVLDWLTERRIQVNPGSAAFDYPTNFV